MAELNGGEIVVKALKKANVDKIFALHGAHTDMIFQACLDMDVEIIDNRHEAASGHAAEGYARISRQLGVALVTAGGGFTNVLTPLANAKEDRTPLLVLTGSGPLAEDETNTLQAGVDQVAVAAPTTKWAHRVKKAEHLPRLIAQAIRIATSAPRGPVLLDLPWDILMGKIEEDTVQSFEAPVSKLGGAISAQDVETTLKLLKSAKRPAILLGTEAKWADVDKDIAKLAENLDAPVYSDYDTLGLQGELPDNLRGGLLCNLYGLQREDAAPDVILQLGLRFGLTSQHGTGWYIPHSAKIVQIDPDARELGRLQNIAFGVQADVGASIVELADKTASIAKKRPDWVKKAASITAGRFEKVSQDKDADLPMHPLVASEVVAKHIDSKTTVVADGALTYHWLQEVISDAKPANFLCHGYLGSMGVGFGTAVGASTAMPKDQVAMLVTGDGSVGYNFTEFDTCVRNGIQLIVIIMNNESWGATQHFQEILCGPNRVHKTPLQNGEYHEAAESFGAKGYLATTPEELDVALKEARKSKQPACINVKIRVNASPPEEKMMLGMPAY